VIGNGYGSRIAFAGAARVPYTSGDDPRQDILVPGNFLYDFCHLRSELNTAGTPQTALTRNQQLQAAVPFLPEFVGSAGARTAQRWSGLPKLTLHAFRGANPDPALRSVNLTWVIPKPLEVTEGTGRQTESVLDTLYLCQALKPDPDHVLVPPSDGFPNAVDYHGSEHGEVVWFGFPLYYFERAQARQVVATVCACSASRRCRRACGRDWGAAPRMPPWRTPGGWPVAARTRLKGGRDDDGGAAGSLPRPRRGCGSRPIRHDSSDFGCPAARPPAVRPQDLRGPAA
jgi:hypothetical protein